MLKSLLLTCLIYFTVYSQDSSFQKIIQLKDSVSLENITEHIKNISYAGGHHSRVTFTPGKDSAAVYITQQLQKLDGLTVEVDTFYIADADTPYNLIPLFNIIATITGKKTPQKQFVVGAHYDCSASRMGSTVWDTSWDTIQAPGADDNATGVAVILEMARLLSDSTINFYNDYTIKLIAYAAEESSPVHNGHHYGSIRHAQYARLNNEQIVGMISVDMIGFNDTQYYTSIVSDNNSAFLGQKLVESATIFNIPIIAVNNILPNADYSDHQSYQDEGYKGVLIIENAPPWNSNTFYKANPFYHKTSDTLGTVNFELTKRVAQLTLVTTASFATVLSNAEEEDIILSDFYLAQNYPNPFNPNTLIQFITPSAGKVRLKVYDILGNEVATLIDEDMLEGLHKVEFTASGLSSGVYIYQLQTAGFKVSKKMILMK